MDTVWHVFCVWTRPQCPKPLLILANVSGVANWVYQRGSRADGVSRQKVAGIGEGLQYKIYPFIFQIECNFISREYFDLYLRVV